VTVVPPDPGFGRSQCFKGGCRLKRKPAVSKAATGGSSPSTRAMAEKLMRMSMRFISARQSVRI
jgi:hypothetical protein